MSSKHVDWDRPIPNVEVNIDALEDTEMGGFTLNGESFTGIAVSYYLTGEVESRRPCLHSLPHGLCRWWSRDGAVQRELTVYRGVAHGSETRWHPNGMLAEEIYSEFGRPLDWVEYGEDGRERARGSNRNDPHALRWIERNRKLFPDAP